MNAHRLLPIGIVLAILSLPAPATAQVPTPESVIGWEPGEDRKLAEYEQIHAYFQALDEASDRIVVREIGATAQGRPLVLAFISSEENLRELDRWREISARLATDPGLTEEEARELADEGRAIVWIDGGLHARETGHAQHSPVLAHHLVTSEDPEVRMIRERAVILLMPVMNPDGLDIVVEWYRGNVGTEFEIAPPPVLEHEYVGHDINRDWYMLLQEETRATSRVFWHEWYPQIIHNHHQTSHFPGRIFVPPFKDPVNPNIPPLVVRGVNHVGTAMALRFEEEGKPGVISRARYDMWWNGGMRTAPYYHNQIGILTEIPDLNQYATPVHIDPEEIPDHFDPAWARGLPLGMTPDRSTVFYANPWEGGWWRFADVLDYMHTASMAVAEVGARLSDRWLFNSWLLAERAREAGEAGAPYAYVIPPDQWDPGEAAELVGVLRRGGVEVHRATGPFRAGNRDYPEGSWIAPAAQPYRAHLVDLMEPQSYPDLRYTPDGPPEPPFDMTGWTLPIQMGVRTDRIEEPFEAPTERIAELDVAPRPGEVTGSGPVFALSPRSNASFRVALELLSLDEEVRRASEGFRASERDWPTGTFLVRADADALRPLAQAEGVDFHGVGDAAPADAGALRLPHVGLYRSWVANIPEGWLRWVFERYGIPFENLHDEDIREGDLSRFDAVVLPAQAPGAIRDGHAPDRMPEEYVGGLGPEGVEALARYARAGGTVLGFDGATDVLIEGLGLPVRDALAGLAREEFFIPGSLLGVRPSPDDPVAFGMPEEASAFFVDRRGSRSRGFLPDEDAEPGDGVGEPRVAVRYADRDLLLSGWALGEERLAGLPAVVRVPYGEGEAVLLGYRADFRAQPRQSFKLFLNPIVEAARTDRVLP